MALAILTCSVHHPVCPRAEGYATNMHSQQKNWQPQEVRMCGRDAGMRSVVGDKMERRSHACQVFLRTYGVRLWYFWNTDGNPHLWPKPNGQKQIKIANIILSCKLEVFDQKKRKQSTYRWPPRGQMTLSTSPGAVLSSQRPPTDACHMAFYTTAVCSVKSSSRLNRTLCSYFQEEANPSHRLTGWGQAHIDNLYAINWEPAD